MGEYRTNRYRREGDLDSADRNRRNGPQSGTPAFFGTVVKGGHFPTSMPGQFLVQPVRPLGLEKEGEAGSATDIGPPIVTTIFGTSLPAVGDPITAFLHEGRWVSDQGGLADDSIIVIVPGCPCASSPATLHMVSSKPASNNQMFQSATLVYGPTPANLLPVIIQPQCYLSTITFPDPILSANFYYFLTCYVGGYVLTRVYPTSPLGSPYRDAIRYTWIPGFPGNTCSPFALLKGQIYRGGDISCNVTITG